MDAQKVDLFIVSKGDMFPPEQLPYIRERLLNLPDEKASMIYSVEYKNPTVSLVLSLILGAYGIDRFFIGDIGIGIGKLLTCGGCGFWAIVDWFLIREATRKVNFTKFSMMLSVYGG
jgi:TM2 domain-containing membrane protein YozV